MASWWSQGTWNEKEILCQEIVGQTSKGIWSNARHHFLRSHSSIMSLQLTLILAATTIICVLLRPLRMPFVAQIFAGVILGAVYVKLDARTTNLLLPPPISYTLRTFSFLGFTLHSFMLGVETNRSAIRNIGKKSVAIGFAGFFTSIAFSCAPYFSIVKKTREGDNTIGVISLAAFNARTFFMVTCSHLNNLGISNSEIGHMASSTAMFLDIFGMVSSFFVFNISLPMLHRAKNISRALILIACHIALLFICKALITHIVSRTPEGRRMKKSHFILILLIVLVISFSGEVVDQRFSAFLLAFMLPGEPLASILSQRLDAITSGVFFPIFCVEHGMRTNAFSLSNRSYGAEVVLLMGCAGKFVGTFVSSRLFGHHFQQALALSLILCAKGILDVASLGIWLNRKVVDEEEYTLSIIHVLLTGALLLLVRYIPRQYIIVRRRSIVETREHDTFQTLACIFKEEHTKGIIRLLEACHPSRANPVYVATLQLIQLVGRCSMPVMAPLCQLAYSSSFRSNLRRCNRVANAFWRLERATKGYARLQHFIAMAPFESMHTDICKLAYDKNVSLIILPFPQYGDSSSSIREVNKMVLERASCSVGMLISRGGAKSKLHKSNTNNVFNVAMLFVGGSDDHEALAYSKVFATHPNVRLVVVSLKGPNNWDDNTDIDCNVMKQFRDNCKDNERITFREVIVNDGAETTKVVVSMMDLVDLIIVGKHHDPIDPAVFGLTDGWSMEYPELGILGDILASPEFRFSLLVVQKEPQAYCSVEIDDSRP